MPEPGVPKRAAGDLAIGGGPRLFERPLHVGRPNIGDREVLHARIDGILDRAWLSNDGVLVHELEDRMREIAGVEQAVAVVNATTGIELLVRALDLEGEVVTPSFTFVGTAHALSWMGATPVFADVESERPVIDPVAVEHSMGPHTRAILGVHLWGHVCDVEALEAVAAERGVPLIYDAAHALMGSHAGRPVGSFGRAEVLSLHATKFVNAFEGGIITTADGDLAWRLRRLRDFGFVGEGSTVFGGTNAKMHEASAAMALTSIEAADETIAINRRNAAAYRRGLAGVPGVSWIAPEPDAGNAQYVAFAVEAAECGIQRDALLDVLRAENVLARRYFHPGCHRLEPYRDRAAHIRGPLTRTERLAAEALVLPTGSAIDVAAVEAICELIRFAVGHADDVAARAHGARA